MMGKKQELEAWPQFQKMPLQTQEEGEPEERIGRKVSQDTGVGDDIDGGECQEIADLFQEQKIAEEVTPFGSRTNSIGSRATSSCSSLLSGGEDARTLELDIFTMCR